MSLRRFAAAALLTLMVGAGSFTVPAVAADGGGKKLSTEERLKRLEDLESIRGLLVSYGRTFDARKFADYGNLFAKEGTWTGGAEGTSTYKGPAAITAFVEKIYPPTVFPGSYHIMSNFDIKLDGKDSASSWSRWTFVVNGVHNEPVIFRGGWYEDTFTREEGEWKFKARRVLSDPPPK
jgi:hypothetical protein